MKNNKVITLLLALILAVLSGILFVSCKTFEPTVIPGQPQKCNDMYTFMDFTVRMQGLFSKDNPAATTAITLMTLAADRCDAARKELTSELRRQECIKLIYGPVLLPKASNWEKRAHFLECLKK